MGKTLIFDDYTRNYSLAETEQGWQKRIAKEQGQQALDTYKNITYPTSSEKPIKPLTAEEFFLINDLEKDGTLVKELIAMMAEVPTVKWLDSFAPSHAVKLSDAWVCKPVYERREGYQKLRELFDEIIAVLVNMNHYIDSRFSGNILCLVMYRYEMKLFEGLLKASWLDINAEGEELTNALYFLLHTQRYYNSFYHYVPQGNAAAPNKENIIAILDKMFDLMLQHGADVNSNRERGFTSLMCAAASGNGRAVKEMLSRNADFTRVDPPLSKDGKGPSKDLSEWKTAEGWANHYGHHEIASMLKAHKEQHETRRKSEGSRKLV